MSKKSTVENKISEAMAQVGEFAKEQAGNFESSSAVYKAGFADLQAKALALTQTNLEATFAFAKAALGSKDVTALFALQQDFVKTQAAAFQVQTKEMNELTMAFAQDAVKPVQDGLAKTVAQFNKATAV